MKVLHKPSIAISLCLLCVVFSAPARATTENAQLTQLRERCLKQDNSVSCAKAGVILEKQNKVAEAIPLYKKACMAFLKPQAMACFLWGLLLKDPQKALAPYQRACQFDDADGCTAAGTVLVKQKKVSLALPFFSKGCKLKDGRGCHRLARHLFRKKQPKKAMSFLSLSCQYGYPPGCGFAGWVWEVKRKKPMKAKTFYQKGCALRGSIECARLGLLLVRKRQFHEGLRYLRRACRWGYRPACRRARTLNSSLKTP